MEPLQDETNVNDGEKKCIANFGGYPIRGMRGYIDNMNREFSDSNFSIFWWQKEEIDQCISKYLKGAVGHINAMEMGMGKTLSSIVEGLIIKDSIRGDPQSFAP